ncbi:MAG: hypothetical protein PHQ12_03230 [Chthoniobacteraceae bacterium]|nr:hypothetical protein [Chthoniobacteraceae bacterium]
MNAFIGVGAGWKKTAGLNPGRRLFLTGFTGLRGFRLQPDTRGPTTGVNPLHTPKRFLESKRVSLQEKSCQSCRKFRRIVCLPASFPSRSSCLLRQLQFVNSA